MKNLDEEKKIAVLIDADNAQYARIKLILEEVSAHGHIITKRAYGDWSSANLKSWKAQLNELAIQPIQQFAYTVGKNSTDASMIIDAMDLLYTDKYDAFALVSSDCDFTKLASRLRESEVFVIGVGERKTPTAFRNACDDFVIVENLVGDPAEAPAKVAAEPKRAPKSTLREAEGSPASPAVKADQKFPAQTSELIAVLKKAHEKYAAEDGWANVASAGSYVKRVMPDFDPRSYGCGKLPDVIQSLPDEFEMRKLPGKGTANIVGFRPRAR